MLVLGAGTGCWVLESRDRMLGLESRDRMLGLESRDRMMGQGAGTGC